MLFVLITNFFLAALKLCSRSKCFTHLTLLATLHKHKYFKDIFLSLEKLCKIKLPEKNSPGHYFLHNFIPSFTIK